MTCLFLGRLSKWRQQQLQKRRNKKQKREKERKKRNRSMNDRFAWSTTIPKWRPTVWKRAHLSLYFFSFSWCISTYFLFRSMMQRVTRIVVTFQFLKWSSGTFALSITDCVWNMGSLKSPPLSFQSRSTAWKWESGTEILSGATVWPRCTASGTWETGTCSNFFFCEERWN